MIAHIENVSHAHPHPTGVPWELVALVAITIVIGVALAIWLRLGD
jgi:hypothetical protein